MTHIMTAKDLKKGSIVEVRLNISPEKMDQSLQVEIIRCNEKYLCFKGNHLQRMGINTFYFFFKYFGYSIVSI